MNANSEPLLNRFSSRRLPVSLVDLNEAARSQFVRLREALFVPDPISPSRLRDAQRQVLADILETTSSAIAALEKADYPIPAAVILRLMQHYGIGVEYFVNSKSRLPLAFSYEQKTAELSHIAAALQQATLQAGADGMEPSAKQVGSRRGGWLKGLPRHPKNEEQFALHDVWKTAKERGFVANNLEELISWGIEQNLESALVLQKKTELAHDSGGPMRLIGGVARYHRRNHSARKGGWLKGVPRRPTTEEGKKLLAVWQATRDAGVQFDTIEEMLAYWHESNRPIPMPSKPRASRRKNRKQAVAVVPTRRIRARIVPKVHSDGS